MMNQARNLDPYKVNGKETRRDIGNYSSAAEVSWMSVGKEQLEYASEALKKFRFAASTSAKFTYPDVVMLHTYKYQYKYMKPWTLAHIYETASIRCTLRSTVYALDKFTDN
jgi:hypothetical protein